jgi:hypothetical protein
MLLRKVVSLSGQLNEVAHGTDTAGYVAAFYEIADMLGIGARADSPANVWANEMKPALLQRLSVPEGEEVVERVARAIYERRPSMTSDQFRRYPLQYGCADAYGRPEVTWARETARVAIAALQQGGSNNGQ